ncbi:exodeoxyribonuclease V subunit gamma [Agrilutibacter solisilvae]|uniref:RecBCD enzyme subunit RecC n=1 Tax=Agrilutibacter solisilvae TaxID=2763317 RepID=A0A974Y1Z7_9GAMM|nr:exodeoxyribonuclease V subunit gamma [Lysobacter solisilvae]QSX79130.1 exodeoxyribonuclease V subunit gamma [Lysobacter solisilvae]
MPATPDFRLYHSNALEVLAGLLAQEVARLPQDGDWLRPDVVLVPQFSMRRWLQQALAEHSGICANLRFLTPGEFVDLALDANLGPAPEADRLAPEALRWHLLAQLRAGPPAALEGFLGHGGDPLRAWSLAQALAETFEKYQAWRRDWLLDWERGDANAAGAAQWQAPLWRAVARGREHRARRIDRFLRRVDEPVGLPPRLFVFACQNMSPDVLQVIARQAHAGIQHFYLHTPARAFWGDLQRWPDYTPADDDEFLGGTVLGGDVLGADVPGGEATQAPSRLLAAWGQAGRDFVAGLVSGETVPTAFELAPHVTPADTTLLGHLQRDVLDNRDTRGGRGVADAPWPRREVDRGDASLQFHACHTRLREVQVLHDQLRALLEAPAPEGGRRLEPRDIAVLAPDIDAYAPHVEAVFGGALGSDREIPFTIADTSPLASAPIAAAFLRLLQLPLRALDVADVLDLLAVPAIAARFDIDDNERSRLQVWLTAAGARWALDADDRVRHGAGSERAYTFEFALDRLLLGHASGADADIAGVAPWPELEGQATAALDGLLRLLDTLRRTAERLAEAKAPAAWGRELASLLEGLFARDNEDDAIALKALRQAIAGFARGAALARFEAPVEHAVVLDHFTRELGASDARAPFLSGGVCFGRMVPMRLIPFEVICVIGMDEAAFPARDTRDSVNLLERELGTRQRRVGDPSRRDADRYLFLQLFTSAGRVFYTSWCGMDPRDNSRREPSAVVAELLDAAVDAHCAPDEKARAQVREALLVRHALQPFSPAAFGAAHVGEDPEAGEAGGGDRRRFSFDARWRPAADAPIAIQAEAVFAPPTLWLPLPDRDEPVVLLDRLRSVLNKPHVAYLRDGLGLRLPEDEEAPQDHEPLGRPDALHQYQLREATFAAWLRDGRRPDPRRLQQALLARAQLAPGRDGAAIVADLLDELAPFAAAALAGGFGAGARRAPLDEPLASQRLRGNLADVHPGASPRLLRVVLRAKGRHGGHALRHGLDWLAASLLRLPVFELHKDKEDAPPSLRPRVLVEPEAARAALESLVGLHERALSEPLPFLPKSGYAFYAAERNGKSGLVAAESLWCGKSFNPRERARPERSIATSMALRGRDPFIDGDAADLARFNRIARAVFAAVEQATPFAPEEGA